MRLSFLIASRIASALSVSPPMAAMVDISSFARTDFCLRCGIETVRRLIQTPLHVIGCGPLECQRLGVRVSQAL
jgi:hypothetical protein